MLFINLNVMYVTMISMNTQDQPRSWLETSWDRFIVEGDVLFTYMTTNFESMVDVSMVPHFLILSGIHTSESDSDEIMEIYGEDIQKELVLWIKDEAKNTQLFIDKNWKPFRNPKTFTSMNLGYNKLFQYKQYFFQLGIINDICDTNCCMIDNINKSIIHFVLMYYGWKENENAKTLSPYNHIEILPGNFLSEKYWNIK